MNQYLPLYFLNQKLISQASYLFGLRIFSALILKLSTENNVKINKYYAKRARFWLFTLDDSFSAEAKNSKFWTRF